MKLQSIKFQFLPNWRPAGGVKKGGTVNLQSGFQQCSLKKYIANDKDVEQSIEDLRAHHAKAKTVDRGKCWDLKSFSINILNKGTQNLLIIPAY